MKPVPTIEGPVTSALLAELVATAEPRVLRGAVAHWPLVEAGRASAHAAARYIAGFDRGAPVDAMIAPPEIEGRFFYNHELTALNFTRRRATISQAMAAMFGDTAETIYVQSAVIADFLPGLEKANALSAIPAQSAPRIWIGPRLTVQTHFDLSNNIACACAGRRRFTLFPPEQSANLHAGPFELTLAGPPVSMARLEEPDDPRYPLFAEALRHAQTATLEPGDAVFIPYFWWHHVQSLEAFNVLVNYWWSDADPALGSQFDALLHAIVSIRDLPPAYKRAWRTIFEHYVFNDEDPVAHLPAHAKGALGPHDTEMRERLFATLANALARRARNGPLR